MNIITRRNIYGTVYISEILQLHGLVLPTNHLWSGIACTIKDKLKEINHSPMLSFQLKVAAVQNFAWLINNFRVGAECLTLHNGHLCDT